MWANAALQPEGLLKTKVFKATQRTQPPWLKWKVCSRGEELLMKKPSPPPLSPLCWRTPTRLFSAIPLGEEHQCFEDMTTFLSAQVFCELDRSHFGRINRVDSHQSDAILPESRLRHFWKVSCLMCLFPSNQIDSPRPQMWQGVTLMVEAFIEVGVVRERDAGAGGSWGEQSVTPTPLPFSSPTPRSCQAVSSVSRGEWLHEKVSSRTDSEIIVPSALSQSVRCRVATRSPFCRHSPSPRLCTRKPWSREGTPKPLPAVVSHVTWDLFRSLPSLRRRTGNTHVLRTETTSFSDSKWHWSKTVPDCLTKEDMRRPFSQSSVSSFTFISEERRLWK